MRKSMKNYRILQIHNFYQIPGGEDVVVRNEKIIVEAGADEEVEDNKSTDYGKIATAISKGINN